MSDTAGPAWDLSTEYAAPDDPAIDADLAELDRLLAEAERLSEPLAGAVDAAFVLDREARSACVAAAQEVYLTGEEASRLLRDPDVYAECRLSVNSRDGAALALQVEREYLPVL